MDKKRLLIIHTGGTIAMEENNKGEVKPSNENPLDKTTAQLNYVGEIVIEKMFNIPSPHMTPDMMLQLQKTIDQRVEEDQFDGVVVTHGTDTLEETAYFLDLTVQTKVPIVITGAMKSSNEVGSDGPYNLLTAVKVALCEETKDKGILVVLNDEIHTAKYVTKTHTSNVATFQSPQAGPLGIVTKNSVRFHYAPNKEHVFYIQDINKNVPLIKAFSGMDETFLDALLRLKLDGIVIEGFGTGNVPPRTVKFMKQLLEKDIPVVLVSRCFNGIVQDIYGYEGGGKQLKEMGVIFANGLNGQKARIKLMVSLGGSIKHERLKNFFH